MDDEQFGYCTVFVRAVDQEAVKAILVRLLYGPFERRNLAPGNLIVSMLPNSYASDPPDLGDDFVVWSTMIELSTEDPGDGRRFVATNAQVISALWDADLPAVAACDFEDELPWNGGIRRVQSPPVAGR